MEQLNNQTTTDSSLKKHLLKTFLVTLGAVLLVTLGAGGIYAIIKQKPEWLGLNQQKSPEQIQSEVEKLVSEVDKILELPTDETPTVATVTDIEKVKDQAFFRLAQQGDKVLVYTRSKKAILYRPSQKKIMEVGTINMEQQNNQNVQPEPPTPVPSTQPFVPQNTSPTFTP